MFPIGRFSSDETSTPAVPFLPPRNGTEAFVQGQWTEDPERAVGLPVGLQLIGRRHNEEKVLAMLHVVETALTDVCGA